MVDWSSHIISDPGILAGKPVVRGTRLSVEFILSLFAEGWTIVQVAKNYPHLDLDALPAVFAYGEQAVRGGTPLRTPDVE